MLSGLLPPPGWDAKGIWKGGLKTKNPWDWMATRIASETENNGLWTVHSTLHRCVWLKPTDSVNAFEVWFDSCLKFCFCQKKTPNKICLCTRSVGLLHRLRVIHKYGSSELTLFLFVYTHKYGLRNCLVFGSLTGSGYLPEGAYASKLRCPAFRHCDHYVRALV